MAAASDAQQWQRKAELFAINECCVLNTTDWLISTYLQIFNERQLKII